MSLLEWVGLVCLVAGAVLVLNDGINSCTAAINRLAELVRKDKP